MHIIKQKSNILGKCPLPFPQLPFHSHPSMQERGPGRTRPADWFLTSITMKAETQSSIGETFCRGISGIDCLRTHACVCVSTTCQHDSGESVVIVKTHITSSPAEANTHPNITREHKMRLSFKCVSSHKNIAARTSYLSLSSWDLGWPSSPAPPTTADHVHLAHCTGDSQDIPAPSTAA